MPNTFEDFKKNASSFESIFISIEQIIQMIKDGKPTDDLIQNCADLMVIKHHKKMGDQDVLKFMNLTATACCSCSMRRPFLKELIISALEQALKSEIGPMEHNICVRADILKSNGFLFGPKTDISDLSRRIKHEIPQIGCIFIDGINTRRNDIRFSLTYNFGIPLAH